MVRDRSKERDKLLPQSAPLFHFSRENAGDEDVYTGRECSTAGRQVASVRQCVKRLQGSQPLEVRRTSVTTVTFEPRNRLVHFYRRPGATLRDGPIIPFTL
ncbi:unnamed protein product [Ixodes persulcatus]